MNAWPLVHALVSVSALLALARPGTFAQQVDLAAEPAPSPPALMISEFMADNSKTLHDEDGSSSDWIELFNPGDDTVDLEGWSLTDDPANLTKWRFPNAGIGPQEYLVVFASEKDRTNATARLHTNFKLSTGGEYLALVSPEMKVVSEFAPAYPQQFTDVSYGRVPGAPDAVGYFLRPTPGAPNAESGPGFAPGVEFSQPASTFTQPFTLQLTAGASQAVIRYTLDGNLPTNTSPVYVAPLRITNSVQIRARAYQDGLLPGPPRTETYVLLSPDVAGFKSDLPVLILHALGKGAPTDARQSFALCSVFEPVDGTTALTNPPTLVSRSGIKVRGSSTDGLPKASYALELWDEFNQGRSRSVLGLPSDTDWVLYAPNQFEPVLIHNPFIHQLSRDLCRYSSRTRFVEVYLNKSTGAVTSANYNGIYVLEEKIKIGRHRVDIDQLQTENVKPPEVTGGYLLKIDRLDPGDSGFSAGGQVVAYVDPKEKVIKLPQRDPQEQYIKGYFGDFARALNGTNWLDPVKGYAAYFDVDAAIDFHVLELLSGNVDALVLSTYFHKPRGGKIVFGPHWDFDRALGSTDGRDSNPRNWTTGPFFTGWWGRLFRDPDFWQKWIDRYHDLRGSLLSRTNLNALIDRLADEVRQAQPREQKRWRVPLRGGTYQAEVDRMKNWLSNRTEFIDRQFVRPPELGQPGGQVTPGFMLSLEAPANVTIYYTLDGSDPRLGQGGIATRAQVYSGPVVVDQNVRVVARARNSGQRQIGGPPISSPWSAPVAATFVVGPPPLVVTELMFRPEPPGPDRTNSASDFEFLEMKNVSSAPVDLPGYHFVEGIAFTFNGSNAVTRLEPGQRLLLVRNEAAFRQRYPQTIGIAGEFTGSLAKGSHRLTLLGPLQEPIFDFSYDKGWQPLADGFGFSLVLENESIAARDLADPLSWRLSTHVGGSPGQPDPRPAPIPQVVINELLTNPGASQRDALELFNPGGEDAAIGGWYLTDDFREPKKYRLGDGLKIPPHGYLWFKSFAATGATFSFNRSGEQVYLFSADAAGNLTGWYHGFAFDAADPGVSFGRYVNSVGLESFVAQTRPTIGTANAGPRVGPVVIEEIMYHPLQLGTNNTTADEFIELRNISQGLVPLFDTAHPTNTWSLKGGVDFAFPANTILQPNERVIVAGFDPGDTGALSRFHSRYGIEQPIRLFGPWRGRLNNAGDAIRLFKPGAPQASGAAAEATLPEVLVEQVSYRTDAPWPPAADGTGFALLRRDVSAFADDPANWRAALPTPGDADSDGDGLPDRWEIAHELDPASATGPDGADADPDQDGLTNVQEFLSGTLPRNPESRLSVGVSDDGGTVLLTFQVVPGRAYTVEYRETMAPGPWRKLQSFVAGGDQVLVEDKPGTGQRFYRLATP